MINIQIVADRMTEFHKIDSQNKKIHLKLYECEPNVSSCTVFFNDINMWIVNKNRFDKKESESKRLRGVKRGVSAAHWIH